MLNWLSSSIQAGVNGCTKRLVSQQDPRAVTLVSQPPKFDGTISVEMVGIEDDDSTDASAVSIDATPRQVLRLPV